MMRFLIVGGGVALILFGARFLRKGLDRLFGARIEQWMRALAGNRLLACLTGTGIAVLLPSSTTVSILACQQVQAGYMTARQMLAVMLGVNVGFTALIILISFRIETYVPIFILVGVVLFQFTKARLSRGIGQIIISLAFIFLAIGFIKEAVAGLDPNGDFVKLVHLAQDHVVMLALIGMILAVVLQSSTAAIGLVIGLAAGGRVELPFAVAVVAGANVGLGVNTLMIGWPQIESRRLGLGNLLTKLTVAIIVLATMPGVTWALEQFPGALDKRIAAVNTGFNIFMALLFLPLLGPLVAVINRIIPERPTTGAQPFGPRYLDPAALESFSLAVGQSAREIIRTSEIVRAMLDDLWRAMEQKDIEAARKVQDRDDQVDLLDDAVKHYLTRVSEAWGDQDNAGEIIRQLRFLNELETIGDIIDKNLADLVIKSVRQQIDFPSEAWDELNDFYRKIRENILIAETAFNARDASLGRQLLRHKERINQMERDLRDRHLDRLKSAVNQNYEATAIYLDLLTHLKRINSSVAHVGYALVQGGERT